MSQGYTGLPPYYSGSSDPITPNIGFSLKGMDPIVAYNFVLADAAIGSGSSSVKINGSTISNPNFNNTTPAAPASKVNVIWQVDGSGNVSAYVPISGSGTVTSVALTAPSEFSVAGSPITTAGTLAITKATQIANTVWAGPTNGAAAQPTFRSLVAADLPAGTGTVTSVALTVPAFLSVAGSPITTAGTLAISLANETANTVFAGPTTGGAATPGFRALVAADLPAGTGTVTTFSAGNLAPLFTTSVANPTTTPALSFALTNAGGGTVFGNNSASAAGPSFTIAPVLGIPGTSTGTIALASSTASGQFTLTAPASAATPTLTLPTTSNVLAGQIAGDGTIFSNTLVPTSAAGTLTLPTPKNQSANLIFSGPSSGGAAAPTFRALVAADLPAGTGTVTSVSMTGDGVIFNASVTGSPITTTGTLAPSLLTQTKNTFLAGPASGANAAPTFRAIGAGDIPTGTVTWDQIGNAAAALTLANAGNNTTIQNTAQTNFFNLINITAATSGASRSSPLLEVSGKYWTGAASATDTWSFQDVIANGTNGASALTFAHSGSTGAATLSAPATLGVYGWAGGTGGVGPGGGGNTNHVGIVVGGAESARFGLNGLTGNFDINLGGGLASIGKITIGNGSGYITRYGNIATVGIGMCPIYAGTSLSNQSAAVGSTLLYAVPALGGGMYRISWTATISTAASSSSILGGTNSFRVTFTDITTNGSATTQPGPTSASNTVGTQINGTVLVTAASSSNINFTFDYTSVGVTAMQYAIYVRIQEIG